MADRLSFDAELRQLSIAVEVYEDVRLQHGGGGVAEAPSPQLAHSGQVACVIGRIVEGGEIPASRAQ
jgi:hypothetical protein